MGLLEKINKGLKIGSLVTGIILSQYSYGQATLNEIESKYNTDTMSFNVENVIKLEEAFGLKKDKYFDKIYDEFINNLPSKNEIDSLAKGKTEKEKAEIIFEKIGSALYEITNKGSSNFEEFFISQTYQKKYYINDCNGYATFYASGFEKIFETPIDSTPFRFIIRNDHVYVGYKLESGETFSWETLTNDHRTENYYDKVTNDRGGYNYRELKSEGMWGSEYYYFAIKLKQANKIKEAKKMNEKAMKLTEKLAIVNKFNKSLNEK